MLRYLNRNLMYLFLINIAFGLSSQMINPLLPLFLDSIGAKEAEIAYIVSAGSLAATLLMLPSGIIIDRVGRKIFLLLNAGISAFSIFMMSKSSDWRIVFPFYVLFSLVGAFFVPARMSMISENATMESRAALFGVMNMAWPITGIISPVLSGWIVEKAGWSIVYIIATIVSGLSLLPALLIHESKVDPREKQNRPKLAELLKEDSLRVLVVMSVAPFLMTTAIGAVNLVMPLYLSDAYKLSPSMIGLFFTASNVFTLLTQIPSGRLADRFDPKRILLSLTTVIPIFFVIWHFSDQWLILLVAYSLSVGLWTMTWPSNLTTISREIPREFQGAGYGINATGLRMGFTVGPLVASYMYGNMFSTSPFLFAAASSILALPVISLLKKRN